MKKTLSLILALLMVVACASSIFAADEEVAEAAELDVAIADVEEEAEEAETSLYDEAIAFLNAYGIYKGYGNAKMGANDDIQRYQMALFTARIATGWVDDAAWNTGIWDAAYTAFTDVNEAPAANYLGAISYANQNGIIEGYGDGTFGPTDGITYQNALTMVVRALGYQNLAWPWGYIEKAINLGLTAGIVDVAYTDVLTRGEVAQVIYNALFATAKDGTTLAAKNFGIEFGWETIIIVASDGAFYAADGKKADKGIVAYKVVGSDGTLGEDTYYTKASTFGFDGHEDDLAVGKAFKVCFGNDGLLCAKSLYTETIWNLGEKDEDGKYPIQAYLDGYTAVSKFTETTYIKTNGAIAYDSELIIKEATYGATKTWTEVNHNLFAIDWANGNILEADKDAKGNYIMLKDKDGKDTDKPASYHVAWYYNELLDQYYQIKTKADVAGEIEVIGIDLMDEKDVENLLKKLVVVEKSDYAAAFNTIGKPAVSAYASLELFDLNGNGEAEYGLYTSYRLGKLTTGKEDCGHGKKAFIYVSNVASTIADKTYAELNEGKANPVSYDCKGVICGECTTANDKCEGVKDIWWTDDYAPAVDEDGEIINGYVLYNYNKATRELRVLQNLEAPKTGVLRAYNVDKMTVNIDGVSYSFKYDELEGNMFPTKDNLTKNYATRAYTSDYLRKLFNQFVEFIVIDDAVVYIAPKGATNSNFIIVESYAGISNDGYIVVNGYTTKDLKLKQFKIGSYNGWQKGDYFYYLDEAAAKQSFSKGALYKISSYDEDNDAYYVYLAGEFVEYPFPVNSYWEYEVSEDIVDTKAFTFEIDGDGYIQRKKWDEKNSKWVNDGDSIKMTADDKWIILGEKNFTTGFAPMAVYTGKIYNTAWTVTGDRVQGLGDNVYFIVNAKNVYGFDFDVYANSYVVFLRNAINAAKYDEFDAEDYYLLGASTYDVIVFDLLDGSEKTVTAQNVNLKKSYVYKTIDGKIVDDTIIGNFFADVWAAYWDKDSDVKAGEATADYISGLFNGFNRDFAKVFNDKGEVSKDNFSKYITKAELGFTNEHKGYCDGIKIFYVKGDFDNRGNAYFKDIIEVTDKDVYKKNCKADSYTALWIYDVDTMKVVIYISDMFSANTEKIDAVAKEVNAVELMPGEAYLRLGADGYVTKSGILSNETVESATIENITLYLDGLKVDNDTHTAIINNDLYFGFEGECLFEDWNCVVDGEKIYGSLVEETYDNHEDEVDPFCNLIKALKFDLTTPITVAAGSSKIVPVYFELAAPFNGVAGFNVEISVNAAGKVTIEFVDYGSYAIELLHHENAAGVKDGLVDLGYLAD